MLGIKASHGECSPTIPARPLLSTWILTPLSHQRFLPVPAEEEELRICASRSGVCVAGEEEV